MIDGFDVGGLSCRAFPSSSPIGHGLGDQSGFGKVIGKPLRFSLNRAWEVLLKDGCNLAMKLPACTFQQGLIGSILH